MEQIPFTFELPTSAYGKADLALLTPDEIFLRADETLLERLGEDPRLERKRASIHGGELGEYYSMWSNTNPSGGLIVIGQENKVGFSGCLSMSRDRLNNLEQSGIHHCPDARIESKRVEVKNLKGTQDFVVLVRVHYNERRVVKTISGTAYIRYGESKVRLTPDQIHEHEAARGQGDFEQESVDLVYPSDFRMDLVRQYTSNLIRRKGLAKNHADVDLLAQTRLGRMRGDSFYPNMACALLFAKDPLRLIPGCKIQILKYDGEYERTGKDYNVIKTEWVEAPIPELIDQAAGHIRSQLREFSKLHPDDGRFYTAPEYPEDAWYEALVNACVHRSYVLKNMVIFVKIFDDKLIVESPGGFPPNVTAQTIYGNHSPRNPHMMSALYFLDLVKCHAEGTTRMRDAMGASSLPHPEFAQTDVASGFNAIRVTLRNNVKLRKKWLDAEASHILGPEASNLMQNELRILNFVSEYNSINVTQAMRLIPTPRKWQSVKKLLDKMESKGLLKRHHSPTVLRDSHACYKLPEGKPE